MSCSKTFRLIIPHSVSCVISSPSGLSYPISSPTFPKKPSPPSSLATPLHPTPGHIPLTRTWLTWFPAPESARAHLPAMFQSPSPPPALPECLRLWAPSQFQTISYLLTSKQYCLPLFLFPNGKFLRGTTMQDLRRHRHQKASEHRLRSQTEIGS